MVAPEKIDRIDKIDAGLLHQVGFPTTHFSCQSVKFHQTSFMVILMMIRVNRIKIMVIVIIVTKTKKKKKWRLVLRKSDKRPHSIFSQNQSSVLFIDADHQKWTPRQSRVMRRRRGKKWKKRSRLILRTSGEKLTWHQLGQPLQTACPP